MTYDGYAFLVPPNGMDEQIIDDEPHMKETISNLKFRLTGFTDEHHLLLTLIFFAQTTNK